MAETLHFALPQHRPHPAFNSYSLDLHACAEAAAEGIPFELSIANSLWGQQGFAFLPEFLDLLGENDGAAEYGIGRASMLHFDKSALGMRAAYGSASRSVSDLRAGKAKELRYTDEERKAQEELRKKGKKGEYLPAFGVQGACEAGMQDPQLPRLHWGRAWR